MLVTVVVVACGAVGVGGLVTCSVLLVFESRLTFAILREETNLVVEGLHVASQEQNDEGVEK